VKSEANERMVRDHDTNSHIADRCGGCSDDKVEDVAGVVGRQIPLWEGAIFRGKGWPIIKYSDCQPRTGQKRPNQSRCHLGCRLRWVQGSLYWLGCTLANTT